MLSPVEKILLARAHRVGAWLDEAVTNLTACKPADMPTLEDLATIGWETVARILWIRHKEATTLFFRRDTIECVYCLSVIKSGYECGHLVFTVPATTPTVIGSKRKIFVSEIQCPICRLNPVGIFGIKCDSCQHYSGLSVVVTASNPLMIEEMFGEEIKDYEQSLLQLRTTIDNNFDISRGPGKHEVD